MSNALSPSYRTSRIRLRAGPLAADIDEFADWLFSQGYVRSTIGPKLAIVGDLGNWLKRKGLGVEVLNEQRVEAFLLTRDPRHRSHRGESDTCRQLLNLLRVNSRIPTVTSGSDHESPIDRIEHSYRRFLVDERGLNENTARNYLRVARCFLVERFATHKVAIESLTARDANRFVLRQARRVSRPSSKLVVTALRSFLRFLHQRGHLTADVSSAVLPVVNWRLSGLPKALAPEQVETILGSCNRDTAIGRRDRAILLLLARLGLRAGEVAALTLDDFNWDDGVMAVTGKGQTREVLPLPRDVGEALTEYLQAGRPQCPTRRLFIRMYAPHLGLSPSGGIYCVVRRALARAGLDPASKGPHQLRHSLATAMLRNGATLEDIGQVLRHRHPQTTQIYAKVDLEALRTVAPAWSGGAA